jgi:hypothetical protein
MSYYNKYLKYKNKYLELSKQSVISMQGGSMNEPWVCNVCTFAENYGNKCNVCERPRPGGNASRAGVGNASRAGVGNASRAGVGNAPRAGVGNAPGGGAGDESWTCNLCTVEKNYGNNCNACRAPRAGVDAVDAADAPLELDKFKRYHKLMGGSNKPTLQNILTSADEYVRFQFPVNAPKRQSLLTALGSILGATPCLITTVRGNGLCALNATSMSLFCMMPQNNSYEKLMEQTRPYHNRVDDTSLFMPHDFKFNIDLYDYCIDILRRVDNDFSNVTRALVETKAQEMSRRSNDRVTPDYVRTIMKDNFDWESKLIERDIWPLEQIGQIISSNIGCVIITIEIENNSQMTVRYSGIFPGGEFYTSIDKKRQELKENIKTRIVSGDWKVVFNINLGTHYNSILPRSSDNITRSHIDLFLRIIDRINWI